VNKTPKELYEQRVQRIKEAMNLREPDRIPIFFQTDAWVAWYAGFTVQELAYNYEKLTMAWEKVIKDFQWDAIYAGGIWPAPMFDAVGAGQYVTPGTSIIATSSFQFPDASWISPEEYDNLMEDPYSFIVEEILPRKCSELAKSFPRSAVALAKGALEFARWLSAINKALDFFEKVYGMPPIYKGLTNPPLDVIADHFRGFKGICLDIKRYPEKVKAACEALLPLMIKFATVSYRSSPSDYPPVFLPLHIAPFLKPKDFEEFYWPTFKKLIEALVVMGFTCFISFERNWEPYIDFLKELPKRKIIGIFESGELKRFKESLGDVMCISGGIPNDVLGMGTVDDVIKCAKKIIDELSPGGGFIFSSNKALLTKEDAKPENLRAVTEFVKKHGVYKR
jgi:hypothetical protein